jgi:uncharacterized protein (AIM24 family)
MTSHDEMARWRRDRLRHLAEFDPFDGHTYAAYELFEQLKRGPYEGEDFFRLRVTGNGETKTVNVTPGQLHEIARILDRRDAA